MTSRVFRVAAGAFRAVAMVVGLALSLAVPALAEDAETPKGGRADMCAANCFLLSSVAIDGVTTYPLASLAHAYEDRLAQQVSIDDLVQSANAITEHYRRDGYFLTRAAVASSDAKDGSARIVVYEGYFSDVQVDGDGAEAVRPVLAPLVGTRQVTLGELNRHLTLASDTPGIKLASRIEPILGDPAQHRLVVTAELDRTNAGLYVDNRGSDTQGPWQAYVWGQANSVLMPGDQLSLALLTVPDSPSELTWAEAAYSVGVATGGRVKVSVSGYDTDAPAQLGNGWIGASSRLGSMSVVQPLVRSRGSGLWLNAGVDVRQVHQTYSTGGGQETLTTARVSVVGQRRLGAGNVWGSLQVSQGLDVFGATDRTSLFNTRSDATAQFTKVNGSASIYQDVGRWAGIYAEVSGQWSAVPLLASEEFMVGGPTFGRAYNYGEISGDKAVAGMVEARVGWDPQVGPISFLQAFAFIDAAKVWNFGPGGDQSDDLASAGFGSRITLNRDTTFKVELAKPLTRAPYTENDNGWRAFVSLSKQF